MPETNPPHKPGIPSTTRRTVRVPAVPPKPTASHAVPEKHGAGTRGPPGTTHVKTRRTIAMKKQVLEGPVEIVSSGGEADVTDVRHRVRGDQQLAGLSLRQKIMISMASVTILTTLLIFVVVYSRSVDLLNQEIDAKGIAQTRLMMSIDPEFWITAMYGSFNREIKIDALIKQFDPKWQELLSDVVLEKEFRELGKPALGAASRKGATDFLREVARRRKDKGDPGAEEKLVAMLNDEAFMRDFRGLFDPFGDLQPFKTEGAKLVESGAIEQLSVNHIKAGSVAKSVALKDGGMMLDRDTNRHTVGDVHIFDAYVKDSDIAVRCFKLDSPPVNTRIGEYKLQYFVILRLKQIENAKSGLMTIILVSVGLAAIVGLAIAWWISEKVSEPVRILMDDIMAVSDGDLDHETVPRSNDEIGQLAITFNRMTQALKAAHNQELEAKALEHELSIAAEIQANLVPKKMLKLPGYDISAYYRPSKEVGGDYYDFIEIDQDHCGFIVADVSGKGVPGSLVMSMARAFIRMEAERAANTSTADTLKKANHMLAQDIKKGMFVTAMYGILDKRTNELAISSAGHNPMVLWRAASNTIELVNPKGMALGFDKGPLFERNITEETVQLMPGDRFVMYTDGVVEAMNEKNEEYGDKRFEALVQKLATRESNQMLNMLVKSLDDHKGNAPQHDDMTIMTVRFLGTQSGDVAQ